MSSATITRISSALTGDCLDDSSDELQERVRLLFQQSGFFNAQVESLKIETRDPLALPKLVRLEAEVAEGTLYRLARISFFGNHAFSSVSLRKEFPIKKGDVFETDRIAAGLESLRKVYGSKGYPSFLATPNTQTTSQATIVLTVSIDEGQQYRMGKLEIVAASELTDQLRARWQLPDGAIYDYSYVGKYLEKNRELLPPGFSGGDVQYVRNCQDALVMVDVRLLLDPANPTPQPKDVGCEDANRHLK